MDSFDGLGKGLGRGREQRLARVPASEMTEKMEPARRSSPRPLEMSSGK